jgi:hypothetical protein
MHRQARIVLYGTVPIATLVLAVSVLCKCHLLSWAAIGLTGMGLSMALSMDYFAPEPS